MKTNYLKSLFAVLIFIVFAQNAFAQYFLKSYDFPPYGTRTDVGRSIERTIGSLSSSSWSIAGFSNSTPNAGGYDWMFLKLNSAGLVNCAALLGFPLDDSCFSHVQLNDVSKRFVLSGFYRATDTKEKASWSMLDTNCVHLLTKIINDPLRHQYRQVVTDPSNSFINAGFIEFTMGTMNPNKILVTRYTPAGIMIWGFKYITPVPSNDEAYSICFQPTDGGYAVTGRTNFFTGTTGAYDVFVVKLTAAGFPIWNKVYRIPVTGSSSNAYKIIAMSDGGYVVIGWTNAFDMPANDVWVFRINAIGLPVWSFVYGLPGVHERGHSVVYNSADTSLALTGFTNMSGTEDILTGSLNAVTGAPKWFRKYTNPPGSDRGYDIELAYGPAGYGVTGQVFAPASASLDPFLMRTDASGKVTPGCLDSLMLQQRPVQFLLDSLHFTDMTVQDMQVQPSVVNPVPQIRDLCVITGVTGSQNTIPNEFTLKQNYPNPFNPSTKIEYSLPVDGFVSLKVFDAAGREVASLINGFRNKGIYLVKFDASSLPSGVYFYKISANGFTDTKKMVLIK